CPCPAPPPSRRRRSEVDRASSSSLRLAARHARRTRRNSFFVPRRGRPEKNRSRGRLLAGGAWLPVWPSGGFRHVLLAAPQTIAIPERSIHCRPSARKGRRDRFAPS